MSEKHTPDTCCVIGSYHGPRCVDCPGRQALRDELETLEGKPPNLMLEVLASIQQKPKGQTNGKA